MFVLVCLIFFIFFFKHKTAYEMLISDWSSDVCSSDLPAGLRAGEKRGDRPPEPRPARRCGPLSRRGGLKGRQGDDAAVSSSCGSRPARNCHTWGSPGQGLIMSMHTLNELAIFRARLLREHRQHGGAMAEASISTLDETIISRPPTNPDEGIAKLELARDLAAAKGKIGRAHV